MKLFEIYEDEKRFYLVTELCSGGELFEQISNNEQIQEKDAAKIILQVLAAISFCHSKGIVHRDIKPENLLIDSQMNDAVKLIDFGTSDFLEKGKKFQEVFGTAYYIAPDILNKQYDEKCDVWSIGVIMYILLAGKPPFDGGTDEETLKKITIGSYDLNCKELKHVSKDGIDLMKKLMTYEPEKRLSAAEALTHPWIQKVRDQISVDLIIKSLTNLKNFKADNKL
mmetsp:Transcript_31068/g.30521  ORF Transcript_31068/g.30521 Transcript_31068/m.30521 type:complete len:225 (+) Transcript_31068:343-1017(+)